MNATAMKERNKQAYELTKERHRAVVVGMLVDNPNAPASPSSHELAGLFAWGSPDATFDESITHLQYLTNKGVLRSSSNVPGPVNSGHEGLQLTSVVEAATTFDDDGVPVHAFAKPSTVVSYDRRVARQRELEELERNHNELMSTRIDGILSEVRSHRRREAVVEFRRTVATLVTTGQVELVELIERLAGQCEFSDSTIRNGILFCEQVTDQTRKIDVAIDSGSEKDYVIESWIDQVRQLHERYPDYFGHCDAKGIWRLHGATAEE